jgi:uncharacterized Tic20 family protein
MIVVIALVILTIAIVVGILAIWTSRRGEKEGKPVVNYRTFFILGIALVPFSIVLMVVSFIFQIPFYIHLPLFALGIIYSIIGLVNRDKWKAI